VDLPVPTAEQFVEQLSEEARSHTREDGTLVIDILVDPPCGESSEREIVVCASDGSEHRLDAPDPPPPEEGFKPEIELSEDAKVGLRAQPGRDGAVEAVVNLTVRF
jgi:hypothetical protein